MGCTDCGGSGVIIERHDFGADVISEALPCGYCAQPSPLDRYTQLQVKALALREAADEYERGIRIDTIPKWLRDRAHDFTQQADDIAVDELWAGRDHL